MRIGKALSGGIAAAIVLTLAADVTVLVSRAGDEPSKAGNLVSVDRNAAPQAPAVAPLTRRYTPHLLVAGTSPLPPQAVERARRLKGVAGLTVV
ncbi:hypothetical protein G3I70_37340, partial [Actinomadura bangladeshensis]|nr:hypothetical protein [Actinomadura bangladeshensis]